MKAAFLREVQLVALEEVAFKRVPEGRSSQPEKSEEEENSKQGSTGVKVRVRKKLIHFFVQKRERGQCLWSKLLRGDQSPV